jgi:hypothetical protein
VDIYARNNTELCRADLSLKGGDVMKVLNGIVFILLLSLQARAAETKTLSPQPHAPETRTSPAQSGTLKIISAKYGAGHNWVDVTDSVSKMVVEIGFVHFPATPSNFSVFGKDPVPGAIKTLIIKYSCSNESNGEERTLIAMDGEEVRIPSSPSSAAVDNTKPQSTTAAAKPDAADITAADNLQVNAAARTLWTRYRSKYACIDGKYIRLPDFNLKYENSRGNTRLPERAKYATVYRTEQVTTRSGGNVMVEPGGVPEKSTNSRFLPRSTRQKTWKFPPPSDCRVRKSRK